MTNNIIKFPQELSRKVVWPFACGSTVTIEVPENEPPLNVAKAVYMLGNVQHQIHRMMEQE